MAFQTLCGVDILCTPNSDDDDPPVFRLVDINYIYIIFGLNPTCTHLEAIYRAEPTNMATPQKICR